MQTPLKCQTQFRIQEEVGVLQLQWILHQNHQKTIDLKYDNTGSTIEELEVTKEMLPYYPLYTDESDYSSLARGSVLDHKIKEQTDADS